MRRSKKYERLLEVARAFAEAKAQLHFGQNVDVQVTRALLAELRGVVADLSVSTINRPLHRTGDPGTSAAAADQIRAQLNQLQVRVLQAFRRHGRMSARQAERLEEFRRYGFSTIRKRISELAAAGLLVEDGVEEEHGPSPSIAYSLSESGERRDDQAMQATGGASW